MKKGNLELDTLGKIILLVIIILILVVVAYLMKDKIVDLLDKASKILRFKA
jgi:hypothetical protein